MLHIPQIHQSFQIFASLCRLCVGISWTFETLFVVFKAPTGPDPFLISEMLLTHTKFEFVPRSLKFCRTTRLIHERNIVMSRLEPVDTVMLFRVVSTQQYISISILFLTFLSRGHVQHPTRVWNIFP
jgi:hypothetical protein